MENIVISDVIISKRGDIGVKRECVFTNRRNVGGFVRNNTSRAA